MTIGALLHDALANNSSISAIVGTRIYPSKLPNNHPTYEAITYQRISNTAQNGSTNIRESRWQISCWAETYSETQALAAVVKVGLEEYRATNIKFGYVANEVDDYDDDAKVYRSIVDVILVTTGD